MNRWKLNQTEKNFGLQWDWMCHSSDRKKSKFNPRVNASAIEHGNTQWNGYHTQDKQTMRN